MKTIFAHTILVACAFITPAQADEAPKLPDQYAEVVLDVQGMI